MRLGVLLEEVVREVLVAEQALHCRNHVAQVERVHYPYDRHLHLPVAHCHHWKVHVLHDGRAPSVHLLHKLPHPIVYNKIVFLFLNVSSEGVLDVEQFGVVDAPEVLGADVLEEGRVELRPFLFNQVDNCGLGEVLPDELRLHCLSE